MEALGTGDQIFGPGCREGEHGIAFAADDINRLATALGGRRLFQISCSLLGLVFALSGLTLGSESFFAFRCFSLGLEALCFLFFFFGLIEKGLGISIVGVLSVGSFFFKLRHELLWQSVRDLRVLSCRVIVTEDVCGIGVVAVVFGKHLFELFKIDGWLLGGSVVSTIFCRGIGLGKK